MLREWKEEGVREKGKKLEKRMELGENGKCSSHHVDWVKSRWSGMLETEVPPPMGEMKEQSALCGRLSSWWKEFNYRAGEEDTGAITLVPDLAKALKRVSIPVVWAWTTHFYFLRRFCVCSAGISSIRGEFNLKDAAPRLLPVCSLGQQWSWLVPSHRVARHTE